LPESQVQFKWVDRPRRNQGEVLDAFSHAVRGGAVEELARRAMVVIRREAVLGFVSGR